MVNCEKSTSRLQQSASAQEAVPWRRACGGLRQGTFGSRKLDTQLQRHKQYRCGTHSPVRSQEMGGAVFTITAKSHFEQPRLLGFIFVLVLWRVLTMVPTSVCHTVGREGSGHLTVMVHTWNPRLARTSVPSSSDALPSWIAPAQMPGPLNSPPSNSFPCSLYHIRDFPFILGSSFVRLQFFPG